MGQGGAQAFADDRLMHVVEEREQKRDGNGLHLVFLGEGDDGVDVIFNQRRDNPAGGIQTLLHFQTAIAGDQQARRVLEQIVQRGAGRTPQFQDVAEALGRDQHGLGALALQNGVGHHRCGMGQQRDIGGGNAVFGERDGEALDHALAEIPRRGGDLGNANAARGFIHQGDIRKSAANIHAHTPTHHAASNSVIARQSSVLAPPC